VSAGALRPNRFLTELDRTAHHPVHVVWEITLACDLKCGHCGSRAGARRPDELSTQECLEVVDALAALGTREVTLIGGEAYLRRDFAAIIAAVTAAGMQCTLQSGGRNLTDERIADAVAAGLTSAGISLDGLRPLHDQLRGVPGSFDAAVGALRRLSASGVRTSVNTQISAPVLDQLEALLEVIVASGATHWQLQLTVPMGRASDHPQLILQPYQMLAVMPQIAALFRRARERGVLVQIGNNIGYFGPHEGMLRGYGVETEHYGGCLAGDNTMGIEADGAIKGCPSLPTASYVGGNVRELDLTAIWWETPELSFARERRVEQRGFCRSCYYTDVCRGGCTWMAHSLFEQPGDNPFCHHRALELDRQGLRERIEQTRSAPGTSFDHGAFALVLETSAGQPCDADAVDRTPRDPAAERDTLIVCYGCRRHVFAGTTTCPFCAGDVAAAARQHEDDLDAARRAAAALRAVLQS